MLPLTLFKNLLSLLLQNCLK